MKSLFFALMSVALIGVFEIADSNAAVLAYYEMGESGTVDLGNSNSPFDSSGNGHDVLHPFGGGAIVTPVSGGAPGSTAALDFSTTGKGYYFTSGAPFVPADNFRVSIWAKTNSLYIGAGAGYVFTLGSVISPGGGTGSLGFGIDEGSWYAGDFSTYIGALPGEEPAQAATIGVWTNLALERINGLTTFYIDGVAMGSKALYNPAANDGTSLHIGLLPLAGGFFDGSIDQLSIETVPEPASMTLLGFGFAGLAFYKRRQRLAAAQ